MSDEPKLRLPPTPAEVDEMRNTILDLRADLAQARAEAVVMQEVLRRLDCANKSLSCPVCRVDPYKPHRTDCLIGVTLSTGNMRSER